MIKTTIEISENNWYHFLISVQWLLGECAHITDS